MRDTVTKAALLSEAARHAFSVAEYRLRKNARYVDWSDDRRWAYCMEKAFEAAAAKDDNRRMEQTEAFETVTREDNDVLRDLAKR